MDDYSSSGFLPVREFYLPIERMGKLREEGIGGVRTDADTILQFYLKDRRSESDKNQVKKEGYIFIQFPFVLLNQMPYIAFYSLTRNIHNIR